MESTHAFALTFNTSLGRHELINVPHANPVATAAEVGAAMDAIVSSNAVVSTRGRANSPYSAVLVTTERTVFDVID
jgi:hypothetical protein